jgi:4-amino-4-deoxy-L-arabinose transferase-like glycosyltransferase
VRRLTRFTNVLWVVIIGVVALYAFFVVMGALAPSDQLLLSLGVIALAVALAVHLVRVRRAMRDHAHDDEMRELHKLRESRGF